MMMTGTCAHSCFMRCRSSRPERPGMRMSEIRAWGGASADSRASNASSAEAKLLNEMFLRASAFSSTQRMERSSSTIQTVFMVQARSSWVVARCSQRAVGNRQEDGKAGSTGLALHIDQPLMLFDESLGNRQSEAAAATAGHQGIEDFAADFFRNAGAVVDNLQFQRQKEAPFGEGYLAGNAGAQMNFAVSVDGLGGVPNDVQNGLDQLLRVSGEVGQTDVVVTTDCHAGKFGENQFSDPFENLVNVERCGPHGIVRRQHPVQQILKPVGFGNDDFGEFSELRIVQLIFEQLRRPADAAERVFDLVRQIADQFAIGALLLEQLFLARDSELGVNRTEFQQQGDAFSVGGRDRAIQP